MTSGWSDVVSNFDSLMQSLSVEWRESDTIDLTKASSAASSVFDHMYSVQMNGMNQTTEYLSDIADFNYLTRLQLSFELSENDEKKSYNDSVSEVESIIARRLNTNSWTPVNKRGAIMNVTHTATSAAVFNNASTEHFAVFYLDFLVSIRRSI
jgi:hypothetical protein